MSTKYDLLVIGAGPGGYVAAIRAAQLGLKVAVVEKEALGGVCLNWGCIPTKALIKSVQLWGYIQNADEYGIHVQKSSPDLKKMIQRSRKVAHGMSKGIDFLLKKHQIETIHGTGKLKAPGVVEVTDHQKKKKEYQANNIILATGGRGRELPNIPVDGKKILGYRDALVLDKLPKKIAIIGAGAIGVEFSYIYNAIGAEVHLIEYLDRVVPLEDEDISKQLERSFKKSGIHIHTNTEVKQVDTSKKGCTLTMASGGKEKKLDCDIVLSAVGVTPNVEGIGLEELGIKLDRGRVVVDQFYQTNVPGVYAIGDIIPGPALAHVASAEGITCVEKIAGLNPEPMDCNNLPSCTYCQPEIASVGYTEKGAIEAGYKIKVGKFPFSASGKASASGHKDGFVKVIFDAQYGEWLGAHMIGENVTELISGVVSARTLETTGHEILRSVHPHPTMSEAILEAVGNAYSEGIHI